MESGGTQDQPDGSLGGGSATRDSDRAVHGRQYDLRRFQVPVRDYVLGSLLGLAPGIIITNLFAHQLPSAIRNPDLGSFVLLAVCVIISILGTIWLRRKFTSKD